MYQDRRQARTHKSSNAVLRAGDLALGRLTFAWVNACTSFGLPVKAVFFVSLSRVKGEALFGEISVFLMLIRATAVHHA